MEATGLSPPPRLPSPSQALASRRPGLLETPARAVAVNLGFAAHLIRKWFLAWARRFHDRPILVAEPAGSSMTLPRVEDGFSAAPANFMLLGRRAYVFRPPHEVGVRFRRCRRHDDGFRQRAARRRGNRRLPLRGLVSTGLITKYSRRSPPLAATSRPSSMRRDDLAAVEQRQKYRAPQHWIRRRAHRPGGAPRSSQVDLRPVGSGARLLSSHQRRDRSPR